MIKIGFGVTQFVKGSNLSGLDGIGYYTYELYKSLSKFSEVDLIPFSFGHKYPKLLDNKNISICNHFEVEISKGLFLPRLRMSTVTGEEVSLIHSTDHLTPYVRGVPLVATIMDAIPLVYPEWINGRYLMWKKLKNSLWKRVARKADQLITVSEYSKNQISEHFNYPENQITVVPLGIDERFFDAIPFEYRQYILVSLKIYKPYFLHVGTIQPRKNISRLLNAMKSLPKDVRNNYDLILVGRLGWETDSLTQEIQRAIEEGWCKWLHPINDFQLRVILQSCTALAFPSLAEGFGMPVLEGFASRVPVIASNATSLPEVANDSALMFDPNKVDEISSSLMKVLEKKDDMRILIERGYNHAKKMTWEACAAKTLNVYRKVI